MVIRIARHVAEQEHVRPAMAPDGRMAVLDWNGNLVQTAMLKMDLKPEGVQSVAERVLFMDIKEYDENNF